MSLSPLEAAAAFVFGVLLVLGIARFGQAARRVSPGRAAAGAAGRDRTDAGPRFRLRDVDHAPDDLYPQVPCEGVLVRRMPGPDRPDYWLGRLDMPLRWLHDGVEGFVDHLVLAARLEGQSIDGGAGELTVGIAYVVDPSLRSDAALTFDKVRYVAVGTFERL